uniref:Zinc finger C2H2 LYAR-type domain-containing protein n=1 Tax=Panagrolaimus sp. PS1159 TaxID=55785 RepID=A0AC35FPF5_9BILA
MVSFTCGTCNEVMKKNQVKKHTIRCRTRHVACLDCNVDFPINEYEEHRKCITEEEKYQGSTYQPKVNKGEIKQAGWAALVGKAKKNATDPRVKKLLNQIEGYDNVPRKKPKFVNFVSNCAKCRDKEVAEKTFDLIKAVENEEKSVENNTEKPAKIVTEKPAEISVEEVVAEEPVIKKKKNKAAKVAEIFAEDVIEEEPIVKKKKSKSAKVAE